MPFKPSLAAAYPSLDPGGLRHRIMLLTPTTTVGIGGATTSFAAAEPPVTAWASIDYVRGTELIANGQDVTQSFLKVVMWYRREFKPGCRIQMASGSVYLIQNVENIKEMGVVGVLTCLGIGGLSC